MNSGGWALFKWHCYASVTRVGGFAIVLESPCDIGAIGVVETRLEGMVLFAGPVIYCGGGKKVFPLEPLDSMTIHPVDTAPPALTRLDVYIPPVDLHDGFHRYPDLPDTTAVWEGVSSLNFVHEFARQPYSALIMLYPPAIGLFESKAADWVVFLRRD